MSDLPRRLPQPAKFAQPLRRRTAAVLSAVVVVAATAGATFLSQTNLFRIHSATVLAPVGIDAWPGPTSLSCVGPLRLATGDGGGTGDPAFDPTPTETQASVTALSLAASIFATGDANTGSVSKAAPLMALDTASGASVHVDGHQGEALSSVLTSAAGSFLAADPVDGKAATIGGASFSRTESGDLRGIAAAACVRPGSTQWLVGGSTASGSSARLTLANPSKTAATVTLSVWGPAGPLSLTGGQELSVPAGKERSILLEGSVDQAKRIAVRVTSNGGAVAATIQDSELRGLVPGGVDYVVPSAEVGIRQVIPGVVVEETQANALDPAMIRVLVPGDIDAATTISVVGVEGEAELQGLSPRAFFAGTVTDVSLAGLPAGSYSVVIESTEPIAASALLVRGSENRADDSLGSVVAARASSPIDRAWVGAVTPANNAFFALPAGPSATVTIASAQLGCVAPESSDATISLVTATGRQLHGKSFKLGCSAIAAFELAALIAEQKAARDEIVGLVVSGEVDLASAVVLVAPMDIGEPGIAVLAPTPNAQDGAQVKIHDSMFGL